MTSNSQQELTALKRAVWRSLHQEHKKIVYLDLPRIGNALKDSAKAIREITSQIDVHETDARFAASNGDTGREDQMQNFADKLRGKRLALKLALDNQIKESEYQVRQLKKKAYQIGGDKASLIAGTDDIRFNPVSQKKRSGQEEVRFAKEEFANQVELEKLTLNKS